MTFMYYEWNNDKQFAEYIKDHKPGKDEKEKEEMEMIKRNYYSHYVDKEFEKNFEFENDKEKEEYFAYCQYFGNLGTLSYY